MTRKDQEKHLVESQVAQIAGGLASAFLGDFLGEATSEAVGNAAGNKAGQQAEKTKGDYGGPAFSKDHSEYLTELTKKDKNIQSVIEKFLQQNPQASASDVESMIQLFRSVGLPPSEIYSSLDELFSTFTTVQAAGDAKSLFINYRDILKTMLQNNPENLQGALKKVVELSEFEKQYPIFTYLGVKPSALAAKALKGGNIHDDLNTMANLAYTFYSDEQLNQVWNAIDKFQQMLNLGKSRGDKWGLQDTWKSRLYNQQAKEEAYQQAGKVVLTFERGYHTIQTGLTKALTAAGIPAAYASMATAPLMLISLVRNLGVTVTGAAPKLAFVEDMNIKLAYGNHPYRFAQNDVEPNANQNNPVDNPDNKTIPTNTGDPNAPKLSSEKNNDAERTSRLQMEKRVIQQLISELEINPILKLAPTLTDPLPANLLSIEESQVAKWCEDGIDRVEKINDILTKLEALAEKEKALATDPIMSVYADPNKNKQIRFNINDAKAKFLAVKATYSLVVQLFRTTQALERAKAQSQHELGFQGSQLSLPAINNEKIIQLNYTIKGIWETAAVRLSQVAAQVPGAYLSGLADACKTQAQNYASAAFDAMNAYNMGGMSVGASSLDKLMRLADVKANTNKLEAEVDPNKSLSDLIELVDSKPVDDEEFEYYDELLPGYGKKYKQISHQDD